MAALAYAMVVTVAVGAFLLPREYQSTVERVCAVLVTLAAGYTA